jgi:hypothetical protein
MNTNASKGHKLDPGLAKDLFGDEDAQSLCAGCPPIIQDTAAEVIKTFGAAPEAAIAVLLNVAAAALGSRVRLQMRDTRTIAPAFSLIVGHNQFRELVWFDMLQAPLVCRVTGMQLDLYTEGTRKIEQAIKQRCADLDAAVKTDGPNPVLVAQAKLDIARLEAGLHPSVVLNRFSIKGLAEQLAHAFDPAILSVTAGSDPMDDIASLKPAERRELVRVLNLSWEGQPIQLNRGTIPGVISLLWCTPRTNLDRLRYWREFHAGAMPAPVVLLLSPEGPGGGVPNAHMQDWQLLVNTFFDLRCIAKEPRLYTLTAAADKLLSEWTNGFTAKLHSLPPELARHLVWLPQLARRLALLMEVMGNPNGDTISEAAAQAAVGVIRALGRAHFGTLLEVVLPGTTAPADNTDPADKMLDTIRKKQPITRRELRRSFDDQHVGWFNKALAGLMSLGKVRTDEEGLLMACQTGSNAPGSGVEMACGGEGARRSDEDALTGDGASLAAHSLLTIRIDHKPLPPEPPPEDQPPEPPPEDTPPDPPSDDLPPPAPPPDDELPPDPSPPDVDLPPEPPPPDDPLPDLPSGVASN